MSESKGKARATQIDDDNTASQEVSVNASPSNSDSTSIFGRIGSSASGLSRSLFFPPQHGSEVKNLSSSMLAESGKGIPNSHGTGSRSIDNSVINPSRGLSSVTGPTGNTIRNSDRGAYATQAEAEFSSFLTSTDSVFLDHSMIHSEDTKAHVAQSEADFSSTLDAIPSLNVQPISNSSQFLKEDHELSTGPRVGAEIYRTVSQQEALDGKDVADLLSNPIFSDNVSAPTTEEEEASRIHWNGIEQQVAALVKTYNIETSTNPGEMNGLRTINARSYEDSISRQGSEAQLARIRNGSDERLELDTWYRFLTSYQDDVWGDFLPVVEEAREDFKNWTEDKGDIFEKSTAVRRLGLILGHMKR